VTHPTLAMGIAAAAIILGATACTAAGVTVGAAAGVTADTGVGIERGRYLSVAGDCTGCHTLPGNAPFAGGLPIETPFGTIYSPNLTPDPDTGLGRWSNENFYRALHEGIAADGSHLYPAFPYPYYTALSRADTDALKAYLDSLPPTRYRPPANHLSFPLNQRGLMGIWNLLFFKAGALRGIASADPRTERGRYLVETLGHCGACHTPTNVLGANKESAHLGGGEIQAWVACNLTADPRSGLVSWEPDQIVEYLKTGRNVHALATGSMREVVEYSTSKLTDDDLAAVASYLKSLPAGTHDGTDAAPVAAGVMGSGKAIFEDECATCHRGDGEALPRAFAPLKGSASVQARNATSVIRVILDGARAATTDRSPTPFSMPSFDWKLNDQEIADVASYLRNAWGNASPPVAAHDVQRVREKLLANKQRGGAQ
jgi:mono/diheme cytochrome c family protein